jgi:DNA topoisomerase I
MNHYNIAQFWMRFQFGGKTWTTLHHNGVLFSSEYKPHNVPVKYENETIVLTPGAEEWATLYARYSETEYMNNKTFNKNFWNEWKKILGKDHKIQSLDQCDFSLIYDHVLKENEKKKMISKDSKEAAKKIEEPYTFASIDGKIQRVGNYKMEPPGIFIGRGCNPKLGLFKRRISPEDVTINISKDAPVPEPKIVVVSYISPTEKVVTLEPMKNHKWGQVIHDHNVQWLASWKDEITNKTKYVWMGAQSDIKAQSDINKFELARKLKKKINTIRSDNEVNLKSSDVYLRQLSTALYLIDVLALRVGNEKGDDETDTVGVTTLRVEHIKLLGDNPPTITLDFHGKDSVRYVNTVVLDKQIYDNFVEFTSNKEKTDQLFDKVSATDINNYLQQFMKDLTAKVFRTYNASELFYKELKKITKKYETFDTDDKINKLLDEFNMANAKVAMLCNHQKNISKSFSDQLESLNSMIKKTKADIKKSTKKEKKDKLKERLDKLKAKKSLKVQLKSISLGTSKTNYIDPRIAISFIKKHKIPIDSIFSKTLQEKFHWAMDVDEDYKF